MNEYVLIIILLGVALLIFFTMNVTESFEVTEASSSTYNVDTHLQNPSRVNIYDYDPHLNTQNKSPIEVINPSNIEDENVDDMNADEDYPEDENDIYVDDDNTGASNTLFSNYTIIGNGKYTHLTNNIQGDYDTLQECYNAGVEYVVNEKNSPENTLIGVEYNGSKDGDDSKTCKVFRHSTTLAHPGGGTSVVFIPKNIDGKYANSSASMIDKDFMGDTNDIALLRTNNVSHSKLRNIQMKCLQQAETHAQSHDTPLLAAWVTTGSNAGCYARYGNDNNNNIGETYWGVWDDDKVAQYYEGNAENEDEEFDSELDDITPGSAVAATILDEDDRSINIPSQFSQSTNQQTNVEEEEEDVGDDCELCELCQRDYRGTTRVFCDGLDCSKCNNLSPPQQLTNFIDTYDYEPPKQDTVPKRQSYHQAIRSCKMPGHNGMYLSPDDAEQIYNVFQSRGMHNITDMLKDKEIIAENIDGSINFKGGYIKDVYFKGMSKLSCKLFKLYLKEKSSFNDYKNKPVEKPETSIVDAIADVMTKSVVRTKK